MALQENDQTGKEAGFSSPRSLLPGDRFLRSYQEWTDNKVVFLLPSGVKQVTPDEVGMEWRYDFIVSTLSHEANDWDVRGAYGEIMGGVILSAMIQEATGGEYVVIPTPPQLDVTPPREIYNLRYRGSTTLEKTADLILGRVVKIDGQRAIQPIMLFDIKACPREGKMFGKIGAGVNVSLAPLPVGIFYLGGMEFVDTAGRTRRTGDFLKQVVHPGVLSNTLQWQTIFPERVNNSSRQRLLLGMCQEALTSCHYTRQRIVAYNWSNQVKEKLIHNIKEAERLFEDIRKSYQHRSLPFEKVS